MHSHVCKKCVQPPLALSILSLGTKTDPLVMLKLFRTEWFSLLECVYNLPRTLIEVWSASFLKTQGTTVKSELQPTEIGHAHVCGKIE